LTTLKEIPVPLVSSTQKIALGILCAKEVYNDGAWSDELVKQLNKYQTNGVGHPYTWNEWADRWLSGENRTKESAKATATSTYSFAVKIDCASSAYYAVSAAAAENHSYPSYDAARAVVSATNINSDIDFLNLVEKAMTYK